MVRLRESIPVKFLCLLLATSLMFISCNTGPNNKLILNDCSNITSDYDTETNIELKFEQMLELMRSINHTENFASHEEFHRYVFKDSEGTTEYLNTFQVESDEYKNLGFEGYINSKSEISNDLKTYLIDYSNEMTVFLDINHPSLEETITFFHSKKSELSTTNLCSSDQSLLNFYFELSEGYANYYYKHYDFQEGLPELRGCNFWRGLACGLLSLAVASIITSIAAVLVTLNFIRVFIKDQLNGGDGEINGFLAAQLSLLALGIVVGVSTYLWCCNKDDIEKQICEAPTGATYLQTDCNEFEYRIFGPSNYENTQWNNINTNPINLITPKSILRFSVPEFGNPSSLVATTTCVVDGSTVNVFPWSESVTFESETDVFPLQWNVAPPQSHTFQTSNNIINVSVNTSPYSEFLNYTWSVNPPHIITGGGNDNSISIKIMSSPGFLVTDVQVENTCLNLSESLSAITEIQ